MDYDDSQFDPWTEHGSVYCPTPAEIKAACKAIQAGWTKLEERRRRGFRLPVVIQTLSIFIEREDEYE